MKRFFSAAALIAIAASTPASAARVGVSIGIGEPGFYGQIDVGNAPRPALIYSRPVIIQPPAVDVVAEPMYLRVPPGQARNWRRYCGRYNACGRPVYFVQDHWYRNVYAPHYRREHSDRNEHHGRRGG